VATSGSKIDWTVGVDWDNDSYICLDATPDDASNVIGSFASDVGVLARKVSTGGTVNILSNTLDSADWAYGKQRARWGTGTTNGAFFYLGWAGAATHSFALLAGSMIAAVWVRSTSSAFNGVTLNLLVRNAAGTQIAGASFTVTAAEGWKRLYVPFTVGSTTTGAIGLQKLGATDATYEVAGPMLVQGTVLPAGFNAGLTTRYDNITRHVKSMRWSLNYSQPFQVMPPVGRASFLLNNPDALYSPDNGAFTPIGANLRPKRQVRVYAENPTVARRVMFAGWLDAISPTVTKSLPEVTIDASDIRNFLEDREVLRIIGSTFGASARRIAYDVINQLKLPNQTSPTAIDRPTTTPSDEQVYTYPRAALVEEDALGVLVQCAGAELAHIFFTRSGDFQWVKLLDFAQNGHEDDPADFTIHNGIMIDGEYSYGEYITNEVTVLSRKRKLSTETDKILWENEAPLSLAANERLEIRANFRDPDQENDKRIAAVEPYVDATIPLGVTVNADYFDTNAAITLKNTTGGVLSVTTLRVRGQKLKLWNETEMTKQNTASITAFGKVKRRIDYKLIEGRGHARAIANYWVTRFGASQGVMRSVSFTTQRDAAVENAMLNYSIMSEIQVNDVDTAHSRRYKLIGEEFSVDNGLRSVTCRWYLEPTYEGPYPHELMGTET
jgi:hypothetical protein